MYYDVNATIGAVKQQLHLQLVIPKTAWGLITPHPWAVIQINPTSTHCVTLTFAEQNRLALSLSGNKPLSAN